MTLSTFETVLAGVGGTYCGLSILLFIFPAILHKRKKLSPLLTGGVSLERQLSTSSNLAGLTNKQIKQKKRRARKLGHMTTIAHRGGSHERLENTMSAFRHAIEVGADVLEIDVQLTMDKRVVICHDNNLERLIGRRALINEICYADLPKISNPQRGSFPVEYEVEHWDREIPLLEQLFAEFPHTPVNLDVKEADVNLRIQVESLVRQYNREAITVWGSWSDANCKQLFKLNPNIPLLMSMRKIVIHALIMWTGLLPFIPIKESFYEPPFCRAMFAHTPFATASLKQRVLHYVIDFLLGNWLLLFHYRRRGIVSWCWNINHPSQFHNSFAKFDGVMTDRISSLVQYVQMQRNELDENSPINYNSEAAFSSLNGSNSANYPPLSSQTSPAATSQQNKKPAHGAGSSDGSRKICDKSE